MRTVGEKAIHLPIVLINTEQMDAGPSTETYLKMWSEFAMAKSFKAKSINWQSICALLYLI